MSILDPFYDRQGMVVEHLAQAAEQIPADKVMWQPCEKALPWLGLVHHSAVGWREIILKPLKGEKVDFPNCFFDPANQPKSPQDTAKLLRETWADVKSFLQSQPDDYARQKMVPVWGGEEVTIESMLWGFYEHDVHHRGQAWVYARMNGVTPPTIWGTEQP